VEYPGVEKAPSGRIRPERSRSIPTHPGKVAGIGSEHRPNSPRKGGRIHVGTVAGLASEWWPDCVGICNVGYSLGISPITDDLLLRTFSEQTTRIIIVLAHNWYPILTTGPDGRNPFLPIPPLRRYSILSEKKYKPAVSPLMNAQDCAVAYSGAN